MPTLLILDDYNFRGRGGQYPAVSTNLINKIMKMLNVYLDDVRPMPKGFDVNPKTAQECIKLLKKGNVKLLSLDHDLGEEKNGTGYDVAVWIEEQAFKKKIKRIEWRIHSDNPVGIQNMKRAMEQADRFWDRMDESVIKNFTEFVHEDTLLLNEVDLIIEKKSFKDGLYEYRNSSNHLVHFSDKNRIGVNPRYRYSTPLGVYGYVANDIYPDVAAEKEFFGHDRRFCHVLEMTSKKILHLQQFKLKPNLKKLQKVFDEYNPDPSVGLEERLDILKKMKHPVYPIKSEGDLFWKLFHFCVYPYEYRISTAPDVPIKRAPIMFNTMLRKMGYDIVIDDSGTIHRLQETQGILLINTAYKQVKTIERFV